MDKTISSFFEQWADEFTRSVEMFTGEAPKVTQRSVENTARGHWESQLASYSWWRQTLSSSAGDGSASFAIWSGADESCWSALAGSAEDAGNPREIVQQILTHATQGAATVFSAGLQVPLRCSEIAADTLASLGSLELIEAAIEFRGSSLTPLLLAMDPAIAKALDDSFSAAGRHSHNKLVPAGNHMLSRLMDLQLPVAVLLGRAVLPLRDILKISAGSLIELDRLVGDNVEVVVHGTVVARGEIVSIKGNYGVRIKEVISQQDRLALKDAA